MSDVSIEMTYPQRDMSRKYVNIIVDHHNHRAPATLYFIQQCTPPITEDRTGCNKSEYR